MQGAGNGDVVASGMLNSMGGVADVVAPSLQEDNEVLGCFTDLFGEAWGPLIRGRPTQQTIEDTQQVPTGPVTIEFMRASGGACGDIDGVVFRSNPPMADKDLDNKQEMNGKVAVVKRGYNTFFEKAMRVAEAGASALIIINWADRLEVFNVADGGSVADACGSTDEKFALRPPYLSIPIVCVRQCDALLLSDGTHIRCIGLGIEHDDLAKVLLKGNPSPLKMELAQHSKPTRGQDWESGNVGHAGALASWDNFETQDLKGLFTGFMQYGDAVHIVEYDDRKQEVLQVASIGGEQYPIPHEDQIKGILSSEYSTMADYDTAVRLFSACMISWGEKTALQDTLFGNTGEFNKIFAMHMNHLEVATRTVNTLRQIESRNCEAVDLIHMGRENESIPLLIQSIADINDVENDICGRDAFRVSLFDIPQMTYKLLQQALLQTNDAEKALALAVQAKARSLVDLIHKEMNNLDIKFNVGDRVRIQGLKTSTGVNGCFGIVTGVGHVGKTVR